MRAAIYARVSVDDRAVSLDAQEAGAREWCARQGHVVVAVHRDDGVSGAEWDRRPGVQRVRAEALTRPRPWDVLVVRDLDRLGRDGVRLPLLLVDLRDAGVSVVEWTTGQAVAVDGMALVLAQLRATMAADGHIERPSDYGYDPMVITRAFWQSGQDNLRLNGEIGIDCPVRLIHGQCDPDVPWQTSLSLAARLRSSDVQTILVKDGDHRLSRDQDIALLIDVVGKLARSIRI